MGLSAYWDQGAYLDRLQQTLDDPDVLLDIIGFHSVAASQEAFLRSEWDGEPWQEKPNPNWAGVITDLIDGRQEPRSKHLFRTQTLIDTGNLSGSITADRAGTYEIAIGSNLPYSGKLDRGEDDEIGPWTGDVRRRLWLWMRKQEKAIRDALGWLLNKKWLQEPVQFRHPERTFVGMTEDIEETIVRDIELYITGEL